MNTCYTDGVMLYTYIYIHTSYNLIDKSTQLLKSVLHAIGSLNQNRFDIFEDRPNSWPQTSFRLTVGVRCKTCKERDGEAMGVCA